MEKKKIKWHIGTTDIHDINEINYIEDIEDMENINNQCIFFIDIFYKFINKYIFIDLKQYF